MLPIQRTLILTVGELAEQAVAAMEAEFTQQEGAVPPVVAWAAIPAGADQAAWSETVLSRLLQISQLSHRATMSQLGLALDRLDQITIWLVADLAQTSDDAGDGRAAAQKPHASRLDGQWLVELAAAVSQVADQRLNVAAPAAAMLLRPRPDSGQLTWQALDAGRREGDVFSRGCYLLGLVNRDSLALSGREALAARAGALLYLLIASPLRNLVEVVDPQLDSSPHYASLGVYHLLWEPRSIQAILGRRAALATLQACLEQPEPAAAAIQARAEAALRQLQLAPGTLLDRLTPPGLKDQTGYAGLPWPWELADSITRARARLAGWLALLERYQAESDLQVQTLGQHAAEAVGRILRDEDGETETRLTPPGQPGLGLGQARLEVVRRALEEWTTGLEEKRAEYQQALPDLEKAVRRAEEELAELAARFPPPTPGSLLKLITHPWRLIALTRLYRATDAAARQLWLRQGAVMETRLFGRAAGMALAVYARLQSELEAGQKTLNAWRKVIGKAHDSLEKADRDGSPRDDIWLEDEFLDRLARARSDPAPADPLTALPYSCWSKPPSPAELAGRLMQQAGQDLGHLDQMDVLQALGLRLKEPLERRDWLQASLAEACPLWQVDPTRLSDLDRSELDEMEAFLRPGSFGAQDEEAWPGSERIVHVRDRDQARRLAIVRRQAGIPSRALLS